jgi:hypothetical protein
MKKIAFFDLSLVGVKRYPLKLAETLSRIEKDVSFVFLYDQADGLDEETLRRSLPVNSVLQRVRGSSHCMLRDLLAEHRPDLLVVMAQRLPDSALVTAAKLLGIRTAMYQHGLYIPLMRREKGLFFSQFRKTFRYLRYAKAIAEARKASSFAYVRDYLQVFMRGRSIRETGIDSDFVNVDHVLVYGEHWKAYHQEVFGYRRDQQVTVGYPDLDDLPQLERMPMRSEACYIAQTLVEDGRLDRGLMLRFVERLGAALRKQEVRLVVKLHPRSDRTLYEALEDVATFETTTFPPCKIYLGHYSSMLVKAAFLTDKILLVDFPGHEVPPYIRQLALAPASYEDDLSGWLREALAVDVDRGRVAWNVEQQEPYFARIREGALLRAAHEILELGGKTRSVDGKFHDAP